MPQIELSFATNSTEVQASWSCILCALKHGYVLHKTIIELLKSSGSKLDVLETLSPLHPTHAAQDLLVSRVEELAARDSSEVRRLARDDCLKRVLVWLYSNRANFLDPLLVVEDVYAELDYPPQIAHFVRYMPMKGPDLGSRELNEARMMEYWHGFVSD
jgi:hypothetical protein